MIRLITGVVVGALSVSVICHAKPIAISDYGGRASGVPDIELIKNTTQITAQRPSVGVLKKFPVLSDMRPGYLNAPIALQTPQPRAEPFFIIGDDEFSRDWIKKNKTYLLEITAQGLATNIQNESILNELKAWVHPLDIIAIPVDDIAQALNINVYPVLITGEEIAQ